METVKEKLDLNFLQFDRHQLMNQLQLISGYLQMNRPESAKESLNKLIDRFHQERKLLQLNLPKFTYWLLMYNKGNPMFRLHYKIDVQQSIEKLDERLLKDCQAFMRLTKSYLPTSTLHNFTIFLFETKQKDIKICIEMDPVSVNPISLEKKYINQLQVENLQIKNETPFYCEWTYNFD